MADRILEDDSDIWVELVTLDPNVFLEHARATIEEDFKDYDPQGREVLRTFFRNAITYHDSNRRPS